MFLHGWGCSHTTLMPLINRYRKKYRCLCVDFFGHGMTSEMPYPLTVFDFAFAVEKILNNFNIGEIKIVAHSFGARVAFILATQCNIKVCDLVLFGPAGVKPRFSFKKFFKIRFFKICKLLSKLKLYPKEKLEMWGSEDYKKLSSNMKKTFINVVSCDLTIFLPLVKAKTLVIVGAQDKETPPYMAKIICRKIKNSTLKIIKNCGHFSFLEKKSLIELAYCFNK